MDEPKPKQGDWLNWLIATLALLLVLMLLWILAGCQLKPASAGLLPISISIRSNSPSGSLSLSILGQWLEDLGMTSPVGGDRLAGASTSATPDPESTREEYEGSQTPAHSPTPTRGTATPTVLGDMTATPTGLVDITATPTAGSTTSVTPSKTVTATGTVNAVTGPSATPTTKDDQQPRIDISDAYLSPPADSTTVLSSGDYVYISGLKVYDPAYSSGMDDVKLKYKIGGGNGSYVYGPDLNVTNGGWVGQAWDAEYSGSIQVDFCDGYAAAPWGGKPVAKVMVQAATAPATLGPSTPPPTPSNTPAPTNTPMPSLTPTQYSSPTPTKTKTATQQASPTPTPSKTPNPTLSPSATPTPSLYTLYLWAYVEDDSGNKNTVYLGDYKIVETTCP